MIFGSFRRSALAVVLALVAVPAFAQQPGGDAAAGKIVANKCAICHAFEPGVNKIGPSLAGVVGRKSASIANYNYSAAMKAANLTWDPAELDKYLTSPKSIVPGTKMIFPGLPSPTDRANVIAYLATNK